MAIPKGVMRHDHTSSPSKGKSHPADINPGMSQTKKTGGSSQPVRLQSGGSARPPKGVRQRDGTANLRANEMHKQATGGKPGGTGKSRNQPSGVRSFDGTRAPRRVR